MAVGGLRRAPRRSLVVRKNHEGYRGRTSNEKHRHCAGCSRPLRALERTANTALGRRLNAAAPRTSQATMNVDLLMMGSLEIHELRLDGGSSIPVHLAAVSGSVTAGLREAAVP
jgi:hypothetical protein